MQTQQREGESAEMYLKTIAELAERRDPVPVTLVAEQLGISTVSASEMVRRLQDRGLLEHTPYKGVRLTEDGRQRAYYVIRRQRLWECFLADVLHIAWEHVHEYACQLEHATANEVIEALAEHLGNPPTCPHGNPIPSAEGRMPPLQGTPLTELERGQRGRILRIYPEEPYQALCSYLADRGIKPGLAIQVQGIEPFEGPISVEVEGDAHVLGRGVAAHILVDPAGDDEA